jgi:iron(III) transport system permease protein
MARDLTGPLGVAVGARGRAATWLRAETLLMGGAALLMSVLVLVPVGMLLFTSLRIEEFGEPGYFSLKNYTEFVVSPRILRSIGNTLIVSTGATLVAGVFGVILAWIHARTDTPGRRLLEPLTLIPFFLSPYVGAVAWSYLAAPRVGMLNGWARTLFGVAGDPFSVYNRGGIIWVLALFFTPVMYLFVIGSLRRMDPALEESARTSGSSMLQTTWRVTLPLSTPSILSGAILVFVSCAGEFGVPLALGSPFKIETMTTQIYNLTGGSNIDYNASAAISTVLAVLTMTFILIHRRIVLPRSYTTVTGKGYRPNVISLGRWGGAALGFNLFYLLVAVFLPLLALFLVSISVRWEGHFDPRALTLANFLYVFTYPVSARAIWNSLRLALAGATICMVLTLMVAYTIHRGRGRSRALLDVISSLPVGFPGIVLAMGILITYIRTPLYSTLWILLVGYITRFMPYGQRMISGVLLSLSAELDQSSRTSGASWATTMRRITLPLLKPGMVAGWLLLFVIFLREFPISALLYKGGLETTSVAVWYFVEHETAVRTAAMAMVQVGLLLGAIILFRRLAGTDELAV